MTSLMMLRRGTLMRVSLRPSFFSSSSTASSSSVTVRRATQGGSSARVVALNPRRGARRVGSLLVLSTMGVVFFQMNNSTSHCSSSSSEEGLPSPSDLLNKILGSYQEQINEMGLSGVAGFCSGYCLKRVSQEVAAGVGAVFVFLQILQHMGYISINYKKVNDDVIQKLDVDGDGKLTKKDFNHFLDKLTSYLAHGLPSASGFACGFGMGFYCGN